LKFQLTPWQRCLEYLNKDGAIDHDEWHDFKAAYDLKHKE